MQKCLHFGMMIFIGRWRSGIRLNTSVLVTLTALPSPLAYYQLSRYQSKAALTMRIFWFYVERKKTNNSRTVFLTWGLEHLTWTGCRSTWRQTTKECLPSELPCSLDVTARVEVQPIGSSRLRLCCWPNNVYTLNWLRLIVQGKASPGWQTKGQS